MASQEKCLDFKPYSPDITVCDYALYADSKKMELDQGCSRRRLSKAMEFKIEQEILLFPYKKVPAYPANMTQRLEFAKELLRFQDK